MIDKTGRTIDDEDLVRLVASSFLHHFITRDWHRSHEKAALTKAKKAINVIKNYLPGVGGSSEYSDNAK